MNCRQLYAKCQYIVQKSTNNAVLVWGNIEIINIEMAMYQKQLLGKRIKELRKSKGFTQEGLAEKVGIDSKHLSRIECGVNFPSLDLLIKIANTLEIEPWFLFQVKPEKSKDEIIADINRILQSAKEKDLKMFYKILVDIISD